MEGHRPDATGLAGTPDLPRQRSVEQWPGQWYPPQPQYRPQPRRSTVFRTALISALAVFLLAPPAAVAFATARRERAITIAGQGGYAAGSNNGGRPNAVPGRSASPGASRGPAPTTVDGKVSLALQDQAAALLVGDQAAFLGVIDPTAARLREDLTRRFANLRQLRVAVWKAALKGKPAANSGGIATVPVVVQYCFVVDTCERMTFETATKWRIAGTTVTLLEFGTATELGPRPWERSDLRAAVGDRVVMATTPKFANQLPVMLAAAEKAAALTDQYAKWGRPPSRYVVYLAGPDEWASWYGTTQESWVAGYAMPLTSSATEIVLNAAQVDVKATLDVLRHEFTHVVTLAGVDRPYEHTWWLVEGIAEYVRVKGSGRPFEAMADVRTYVRSGHWKDEIALDDPLAGSTAADVSGRYGVAFLSIQRLTSRFGEDKMLEFFNLAVREGLSLPDSATKALGVTWDDVAADCVQSIRGHA